MALISLIFFSTASDWKRRFPSFGRWVMYFPTLSHTATGLTSEKSMAALASTDAKASISATVFHVFLFIGIRICCFCKCIKKN